MITITALTFILLVLTQTNLASAQMQQAYQALQGSWSGSNGRDSMTLNLFGNSCTLILNGQQINGMWALNGNQLMMRFQNGKTISYSVALEGNTLLLDGSIRLMRSMPNQQPLQPTPSPMPQQMPQQNSPLDGTWSCMTPQGTLSFRFQGNQYAQLLNGQVMETGIFSYQPDGTFAFRVTGGQYAGQTGQNRLLYSGNSFTMVWPQGVSRTYQRDMGFNQPGGTAFPQPQPQQYPMASPFEGRWIWAKNGPVSFGYIFSGSSFIHFWNGVERERGHFSYTQTQLIMNHDTGPDAGKQDVLGYQLRGNRLLIFVTPDADPIPFVRQ